MIVRFERNGKVKHGWYVEDENKIRVIEGDIYKKESAKPIMTGLEIAADEVEFLTPCTPGKIVCIGVNYKDHAVEMGMNYRKSLSCF